MDLNVFALVAGALMLGFGAIGAASGGNLGGKYLEAHRNRVGFGSCRSDVHRFLVLVDAVPMIAVGSGLRIFALYGGLRLRSRL